jgi:hypothetical protein
MSVPSLETPKRNLCGVVQTSTHNLFASKPSATGRFDLTLGVFTQPTGLHQYLENDGLFIHLSVFYVMNVAKKMQKTLWKHGEARFGASLPMSTMH